LYHEPLSERIDYNGCIEEFLGPQITNHPVVQNSKLTEAEQMQLDLPSTIEELDQYINKANMKSAPGIDGLSNKFIKKYWRFFRTALHRYCLHCFEKNELTANFLSASIKLPSNLLIFHWVTKLGDHHLISSPSKVVKVIGYTLNRGC
jgi:hypothetical protein